MQTSDDPYERFILQHLKHYGLFTGQGLSSIQKKGSTRRTLKGNHDSFVTVAIHSSADSTDLEDEPESHQGQYSFNVEKYLRTRQLLIDFEGGRPVPRLREPLDLFTIPSTSSLFQGVRWPVECEVVCDKIHHIEWDPPEPEQFYQKTGLERTPMPVGKAKGNTIFCIESATKTPYFTRSCFGGKRESKKEVSSFANSQSTSSLSFESRFESGNLLKAVQVGLHDYELTLRNDMYTTKHTQWFYFRVRNMKADVNYRFTIINLMKSSSLYETGMCPLLYSELAAWLMGKGWCRAGSNIRYYRNHNENEGKALYSLTWTLQFPYDNDTCYLAHCYPYTYSDIQCYLRGVISDPARAAYCKVRVLCRSLAGNAVYALTITAPSGTWQERRSRRAVVVTARVHPGETNGSWMMQGFLDFLLGDSPDAHLLRDTFVFKVVPMLNPDGVVVGNYRCSLAGCDLNRYYRTPLRNTFPCVWYTRNMVKRLLAEREVVLYCDFHGHSRKNNVFMYGCSDHKDASLRLQEQIFPLMMSKNATDKFSFRSCKFKMQKSKEGTGRIVMWKLGIQNSYTMESTFGGSSLGNRKGTHFSMGDLKSMGYHFCDTLLDFCDPDQSKMAHCLTELEALLRQHIRQKLGRDVDFDSLEGLSDLDIESSTSGSNSTESDSLPVHLLNCSDQNTKVKKKHLWSRKERNRLHQQRTQSAVSKMLQRNIKNTDCLPSNEALVKVRIQEKTAAPEKEREYKSQKLMVRVNQSGRSWIPHPTTRIGVLDNATFWEQKPDKNMYWQAVSADYLHNGSLRESCQRPVSDGTGRALCHYASSQSQKQMQRQPLRITTVRHDFSPVPVQQYSLHCNSNVKVHEGVRGRCPVSNVSLRRNVVIDQRHCRAIPEFLPARGLEPCVYPTHIDNQQKLAQGATPSNRVSFRYLIPDMQDTMGILRTNKRNAAVSLAPAEGMNLPDTEQSSEAEQLSKHNGSSFPDLRCINMHGKSHDRPSGDQAGLGRLRLGKLPGGSTGHAGDAGSPGSIYIEERAHVLQRLQKHSSEEHKNKLS
ncbi:cytosolic carboxypeptidase 2 isoform X2 [Hoplias malabaricus]|uniref:cytosolic carboxypeptidase 2 isoform X2 n=1 Tax=Hoplias malabaricus TaxID=27720 RepID=UPI0034634427